MYFLYNIITPINNICINYTYITMEDGIEQHLSIMTNMLVKQKIDEENRIKEATNETLQKEFVVKDIKILEFTSEEESKYHN